MNQSQHLPVNDRFGQINSSYSANYSQCSYATPYIIEVEVTPTCSTPYANPHFHNSVPYVSNDYSRINENSRILHTLTHAIVAYTLHTTSAQFVMKITS
jgi:hypothetical protein